MCVCVRVRGVVARTVRRAMSPLALRRRSALVRASCVAYRRFCVFVGGRYVVARSRQKNRTSSAHEFENRNTEDLFTY